MDAPANHPIWTLIGAVAVALVAGIGSWFTARRTAKPQETASEAQVQQAINDGFTRLTSQYDAVNQALLNKIEHLEGVIANLTQHLEGLERALNEHGIPVPMRPVGSPRPSGNVVMLLEAGQAKPL